MSVSEDILVNVTPQETRVAITGSGVVQELLIERAASRGLVGNIYMGRVARVLPGMQTSGRTAKPARSPPLPSSGCFRRARRSSSR